MKKHYLLILAVFFYVLLLESSAYSNNQYSNCNFYSGKIKFSEENNVPRISIYIDLLGTGGILSINSDFVLIRKEKIFINAKVGLGSFLIGAVVPIGISVNFGSDKNFLETGFTVMPYSIIGLFGSTPELNVGLAPVVGYKHFAYRKLYFRVYFSPIYVPFSQTFFPLAGLSVGYGF